MNILIFQDTWRCQFLWNTFAPLANTSHP